MSRPCESKLSILPKLAFPIISDTRFWLNPTVSEIFSLGSSKGICNCLPLNCYAAIICLVAETLLRLNSCKSNFLLALSISGISPYFRHSLSPTSQCALSLSQDNMRSSFLDRIQTLVMRYFDLRGNRSGCSIDSVSKSTSRSGQ